MDSTVIDHDYDYIVNEKAHNRGIQDRRQNGLGLYAVNYGNRNRRKKKGKRRIKKEKQERELFIIKQNKNAIQRYKEITKDSSQKEKSVEEKQKRKELNKSYVEQ